MRFQARLPCLSLTLAACLAAGCGANRAPPAADHAPAPDIRWTFESTPFWQDEFEYTGAPDPGRWGYDIGGGGWGNNELQYYTDSLDNAFVDNGMLTIVAKRQPMEGRNYTSARLVSKGKGDFLHGRIEFRARVPAGRGTWPALWMLPTDATYGPWPASGEIDVMEHVGHDPDVVHVSVHTEAYNHMIGTHRTSTTRVEGATDGFHLYRVDWTPDHIRGYIDGASVFEFANEGGGHAAWPFDQRFHLLMNIAVGGDWGGLEGVDEAAFPARMEIDYVRVYRLLED